LNQILFFLYLTHGQHVRASGVYSCFERMK